MNTNTKLMKAAKIIIIALSTFYFFSCKKNVVNQTIALSFDSVSYKSITDGKWQLDVKTLTDDSTAIGAIAAYGDTLFIANNHPKNRGLFVYDTKNNKLIQTIKTWKFNQTNEKFIDQTRGMCVANGRLYVANTNSRVDVFDLRTLNFIMALGTGGWWIGNERNKLVHSFSVAVADGKIFVRDKSRLVVYEESVVNPQNHLNAPIFSTMGAPLSVNYWGGNQPMTVSASGKIQLSDFDNRKIYTIDPKSIQANTEVKIMQDSTLNMSGSVNSLTTMSDETLMIYNQTLFRFMKSKNIWVSMNQAFDLAKVELVYSDPKNIWVLDQNKIRKLIVNKEYIKIVK